MWGKFNGTGHPVYSVLTIVLYTWLEDWTIGRKCEKWKTMWSTGFWFSSGYFPSSKKLSVWMLSSLHQSITHSLIELHTTTMATNNAIPTSSSTYINEPWVHVASQRKDQSNYESMTTCHNQYPNFIHS
jgi:hypothetical protein